MGQVWNSTLRRHTPLPRNRVPMKRSVKLRQIGKKGKANQKANKIIDAEAAKAGVNYCEAGLPGCLGHIMLTRAHSKKRADIQGDELTEAIYACLTCHNIIEFWPKKKMTEFVRSRLKLRSSI